MKKMSNELKLQKFYGFDFKARVKVSYCDMKNKSYPVHEIVGVRITLKSDRLIDFHISEVDLCPIGYSPKESEFICSILHAN
jgi:hypothetical protein